MNKILKLKRLFKELNNKNFLLLSFAFLLSLNQKWSTINLILLVAVSLIYIKSLSFNNFKKFIPFIALYFLYAIAYFKDSYHFGMVMFEQKASLIAIPIIFSVYKLDYDTFIKVLKAFVYGCFTTFISYNLIAFYNSIHFAPFSFNPFITNELNQEFDNVSILLKNHFLANNFIKSMNATFMSIYFCFAIYVVFHYKQYFKYYKLFVVLFTLGVLQIFSVIGFITLIITFLIIFLKNFEKTILIGTILCFISIPVLVSSLSNNNLISKKLEQLDNRLIIWPNALETVSKDYLFGIGVKKGQRSLESNYPLTGDFGYISQLKKIDAHNMMLQFIIEIGITGFIIFLISIYTLVSKNNANQKIVITFSIITLLLYTTESAFTTYAGLSFFCFFYGIFINKKANEI